MTRYLRAFLFWLLATSTASAQDQPPSFEETQALIERMQKQIERMSDASRQRDEALGFLEQQIERATGRLDGSEDAKEALAERQADLAEQLEATRGDQENLSSELDQREARIAELEAAIAVLEQRKVEQEAEIEALSEALAQAEASGAEKAEALVDAQAQNQAALEALRTALGDVESEKRELLDRSRRLLGQLVANRTLSMRDSEASAEDLLQLEARNRLLQSQVSQMAAQLRDVGGLLDESERANAEQESQIADLNLKLAEALAEQVEELSQYRSEFFGRLKEALGTRRDFRIVGDRFVFQSEVLFASGSARIGAEGQEQLRQLAIALRDVAQRIPPDLDWILRIDGHTDRVPVGATSAFSSNWDLSTARAISVVQTLVREGIPPERLAATGFGEFQPLDARDDEIAYRRNRRIEFKLTSG